MLLQSFADMRRYRVEETESPYLQVQSKGEPVTAGLLVAALIP